MLKKDDTAEACRSHGDQIVYTIEYLYPDDPNHTRQPLTELKIVDYLPEGVYYEDSTPQGTYDIFNRTVTWDSLTANIGVAGSVTLTVTVDEQAEPSTELINEADLCESDGTVLLTAICKTKVCCHEGNVIYVDEDAPGYYHNGTSWEYAYTDLQDAIACVERGCEKDIWIARGPYNPGDDPTMSFEIPAGISVYGGFAGNETDPNQRDIKANPTILSGDTRILDNGTLRRNEKVVVMGNNSLLDGVIVSCGRDYGIYGSNVDFTVSNSTINDNLQYGLWCRNGNLELKHTVICDNGYDGLYLEGHNMMALLENCVISNNSRNGINCWYSTPAIINNVIHHNGSGSWGSSLYYGIRLFQPDSRPVLRNNTIVCNTRAGIYYVDNSFGTLPKPQVKNCIVWHNAEDEGFVDIQGLNDIVHSCLTNPNNVYAINPQADARGNLHSNPVFAYSSLALGNFHLASDSPCVNMGDPNETATTEVDMDNQARIAGTSVEMGADEVDCEDVYNEYDWNADGLVNLKEFGVFSAAWLTFDPNHPNLPNPIDPNAILHWNPMCDLDSDLDVDLADLMLFVPEWCWKACWRYDISAMQQQASVMMTQSSMLLSESLNSASIDVRAMKAELTESSETETSLVLSLINQINGLINTDQNAEAWQEMKSLLEHSLLEIEKTRIKTAEF